jgi:ribosomal protein S27E
MERKFQVLITFAVLVVLVSGLYFFTNWFSIVTGYFTGESEQQRIAACLSDQGAEYYFTTQCADCEEQSRVFGPAIKSIPQVDCGPEKQNCPNIRSLPAWYIPNSEDKINYGLFTLEELKTLSGCE